MSNAFDTSIAPISEPSAIIAGDFTAWRREDLSTDYPTATYTLKYECRREGEPAKQIEITAADDDGDYLVQLISATTLAYPVGRYHWSAYIERNTDQERVQVDSGEFTVNPDKNSTSDDPASLPRRMLTLIEAAIEDRATNKQLDVLSYSLGVETSATRDPAQLLKHRAYWQRELVKENRRARARKGLSHSGKVRTRF